MVQRKDQLIPPPISGSRRCGLALSPLKPRTSHYQQEMPLQEGSYHECECLSTSKTMTPKVISEAWT